MSIPVYKRVWKHCAERGARKLLMLALAEHCDERGICWPKPETLAELIGERTSYTRELLAEAVARGDIVKKAGGGRGNVTIYAVVVGVDKTTREQLAAEIEQLRVVSGVLTMCGKIDARNSTLQCTVSSVENSTLQNTVSECTVSETSVDRIPVRSVEQNSLQQCTDKNNSTLQNTVYTIDELRTPTLNQHEIRHDHGGDGDHAQREKLFTRQSKQRTTTLPRHVIYLAEHNPPMGAAHLFAHLDSDAAIADFDNRIADNWSVAAIVTAWKTSPPQPGRIYKRAEVNTTTSGERSGSVARARRGPSSERAARPGERGYYKRD